METMIPHILNGLILGLLFALIAIGFTLIVGVMELINLAHGSFFALGAYLAVTFLGWVTPDGVLAPGPLLFLLALLVAPVLVSGVGMGLEVGMRRTYGKDPLYGLLLTFGVALMLEEGIRTAWGPGEQILRTPTAISGGVEVGGLIYSKYRLFAAVFSVCVIVAVWALIERSRLGAAIKAGAHDSEMVQALGINIKKLRLFVFGFGTALAAIAGIIIAPIWGVRPHMGVDAVIPAFLIVTLGGVGSFWGSVIAGMMVGMTAGLVGAVASGWSIVSIYLLLIAVLTVRRRGLFGRVSSLEA
jgi:branched-chain amino acid transport system permease protein